MRRMKDVLTTGEVAKICKVAPRTVSKWFDSGKLRGYRIPGSKDRRIPVQQLVRFMRAHNMPLDGIESGQTRVLIVEQDREVSSLLSKALASEAGYDVKVVHTAFEAGVAAESEKPQVMIIDTATPGLEGRDGVRAIRNNAELAEVKLIALTSPGQGSTVAFTQDGYDAALTRPFEVSQVVQAIEESIGVVAMQ